jgi:hypothetical protein
LQHLDTLTRLLADELGVEPAAETIALAAEIRTGRTDQTALTAKDDVKAPARSSYPLPTPATPLFGRTAELARLDDQMAQPQTRLLTLIGPGGMGKTRLALACAARLQATFRDGVCFVPLAPLQTASQLQPALANALDLHIFQERGEETAPLRSQLVDFLRRRHCCSFWITASISWMA